MALITPERFIALKQRVKNECDRRQFKNSVKEYSSSNYDFKKIPNKNNPIYKEHYDKNIIPLNAINKTKVPYNSNNNIVVMEDELFNAETYLTAWEGTPKESTTSDCNESCAGLCVGDCTSTCSTTCSGGCKNGCTNACSKGCSTGCSGDCDGHCGDACGSTCVGDCKGCGVGCAGECTDCGGCDTHNCTGTCHGTCAGNICVGLCYGYCSGGCANGSVGDPP